MAYGLSNHYMTDDVTLPTCWRQYGRLS